MRVNLRKAFSLFTAFLLSVLAFQVGCSSGGAGGGFFTPGIVDLAIGSEDENNGPTNAKVLLYFNVLNTVFFDETLAPDVTLDNATSLVAKPRSMVFGGSDLYVANIDFGDSILIFRDYLTLADQAAPDATLAATAGLNKPMQILYGDLEDTLVVADDNDSEVLLFRNASLIVGTDATTADVTLNSVTSLIADPTGIAILQDSSSGGHTDLFVANRGNSTPGDASVTIYRDIAALVTNDPPHVRLNEDSSFFHLGCAVKKVDVFANVLYVSTHECGVFVFNNANALLTDALPDVLLNAYAAQMEDPLNMEVAGNILWVADRRSGACDVEPSPPGVYGFSALSDGAIPSVQLGFVRGAHQVESAGGGLFINELDPCHDDFGNIHLYVNTASAAKGSLPSVTIAGGVSTAQTDVLKPISIAVMERDAGT